MRNIAINNYNVSEYNKGLYYYYLGEKNDEIARLKLYRD